MRQKIRLLLKNDLVKVSSRTGIATAVKIAANFLISKILAIFVGPQGLALMGQLSNVGSIIQSLGTGGIGVGVTKYVAEHSDNAEEQHKIINTSLKITFICSAICTAAVIIFYRQLGKSFFHTDKYNSILLLLGMTLILFSFNTVVTAIINGLRNFKLYVIINIATSIITLLATFTFVYYMGVYGALLSFILAPALVFFITWFLVRKQEWVNYSFLSFPFDKATLKLLGKFSLMAINSAVIVAVSQIAIRNLLIKNTSLDVAGIWDGMNRVSSAYLLLLTTSIQVYYLPTLSYIKDRKLLWKEIIKTEKIILPLTFLMLVILFFCKGIIVNILFTKEFYLMKDIFIYQLIGDMIKVCSWIIAYTMYAKAMTKQLIVSDTLFTVCYVAISYLMMTVPGLGIRAVYYGYIINNLLYLFFVYFFMKRYIFKNQNAL